MIYQISGAPIPEGLKYADVINAACVEQNFPPTLAYAVANRETLRGERCGLWPSACSIVSGDGGHGLFQLTSWVPENWSNPKVNAWAALHGWLIGDLDYFAQRRALSGDALIVAVACAFNAGTGAVAQALSRGHSPNTVTTGGDYGTDVLACVHSLLQKGVPT